MTRMSAVDAMVCDFCGHPHPGWRYRCDDLISYVTSQAPATSVVSNGDWAACRVCYSLIETGQYAVLTRRSVAAFLSRYDHVDPAVRAHLTDAMATAFRAFATHHTPVPIRL